MALCQQTKSTEQRLEAMKWYFGKRHCRTITLVDDVTGSLDGEYFDLNAIDSSYEEAKYAILLSNGTTTTIPGLPTGTTEVVVTYVDDDSANTIAALIAVAIAALPFRSEVIDAEIEIQNSFVGEVSIEDDANASSLTFEIGFVGFGGYIGQTGESELTTNTELVQLLDDAQGTIIQDEIITGYSAEITIPLKEMSTERWQDLVGKVSGNNITIDSKDITGWGTKKLYTSMFTYAGRLIGHPVRLEASNIDEDICMLNTAPKMNSINFSGASIQEAEFLFTSYKDANAPAEINLLARGDHSKF